VFEVDELRAKNAFAAGATASDGEAMTAQKQRLASFATAKPCP
jgi:hypothetical protein